MFFFLWITFKFDRNLFMKKIFFFLQILKKLKVINLNHSKHLVEFPSFAMMPNLEILTLEGYTFA